MLITKHNSGVLLLIRIEHERQLRYELLPFSILLVEDLSWST
jgi:hypothetical protein